MDGRPYIVYCGGGHDGEEQGTWEKRRPVDEAKHTLRRQLGSGKGKYDPALPLLWVGSGSISATQAVERLSRGGCAR